VTISSHKQTKLYYYTLLFLYHSSPNNLNDKDWHDILIQSQESD